MREFKDTEGRAWPIDLSIGNVMHVKEASGGRFNLLEPAENDLADKLRTDEVLFWEMLVHLCEARARECDVSSEQFGKLMAADCLCEARNLFFEAWRDFFLKLHRQDKAGVVQAASLVLNKAMELAKAQLEGPQMAEINTLIEARMRDSLKSSFGKLRDSLASTPAPSLGGNSN